jgi:DNA-binding transcriptional LysR family regulator
VNRSVGNQVLPFPLDIPRLELFLYWHANVDDDPASRWFRRIVLELLHSDRSRLRLSD